MTPKPKTPAGPDIYRCECRFGRTCAACEWWERGKMRTHLIVTAKPEDSSLLAAKEG